MVADVTRGPIRGLPHHNVLAITEDMAVERGFPRASAGGGLFWYCTDYLHHLFFDAHPGYSHYVAIEHDVVATIDLDAFVDSLSGKGIDYVGRPISTPVARWPWYDRHLSVYPAGEIRRDLYCFSAFSARAMTRLRDRRLAMGVDFRDGILPFWPIGEAFIPTEVARAGLVSHDLGRYGDVARYDWWPPIEERHATSLPYGSFAHPVLVGDAYVRSVLRHEPRLSTFLLKGSDLRSRLSGHPLTACLPHLRAELARRALAAMRRRLEWCGLMEPWTTSAHGGVRDIGAETG